MIEVKSKFDASITTALLRLELRKLKWLLIVSPLLLICLGILVIVTAEPDAEILGSGIYLMAIGVLLALFLIFLPKLLQKTAWKSMKLLNTETTNYFRFDETKIYQEMNKGEEYKSTGECSYSLLYKAYETKSHFFLYISRMQTHAVPKKDIITGTAEELAQILSDRLGKSFKVINVK
jgi:hypothetical protein